MDEQMESDKYLWQPRRNGPIYFRVTHKATDGRLIPVTRSLRTSHWPTARKIRDTEFMPLVLDINKAKAQLDIIRVLYPQLLRQLPQGVHGGWGPDSAPDTPTLQALSERWGKAITASEGNYAMAERSARRYRTIAAEFVRHVGGDRLVHEITRDTVSSFRDERLQTYGRSKKTVDLEITALRSMFSYAVDRMGLEVNPAAGVSVTRTKAERNRESRVNRRRMPTHEEADRLCASFPAIRAYSVEDCQDYALFARYTGMRQGEIAQLHADDALLFARDTVLDAALRNPAQHGSPFSPDSPVPEGQVVCLFVRDSGDRRTKTGLERLVPVAAKLLPVLIRRLRESSAAKGPLFRAAEADRGAKFGRAWLKGAKKIDAGLTMHGFRHFAASEMEGNKVATTVASAVLGHVENSVHAGYVHVTVGAMQEAVDTID